MDPEQTSQATTEVDFKVDSEAEELLISHPVKKHVKEAVGIPEGEPAALMYHFTRADLGYNVMEHGFVNVAGRGTLAPILDLDETGDHASAVSVMETKVEQHGKNVMLITFCLPAKQLREDTEGKYGMWFDNRLQEGQYPELWEVYKRTVIKYDSHTGQPTKWAKDDPSLYPVFVPPQYILGVSQPTQ